MKDERGSVAPSCARLSVVVSKLYPGTSSQVNRNALVCCGWDSVRPNDAPSARCHALRFGGLTLEEQKRACFALLQGRCHRLSVVRVQTGKQRIVINRAEFIAQQRDGTDRHLDLL